MWTNRGTLPRALRSSRGVRRSRRRSALRNAAPPCGGGASLGLDIVETRRIAALARRNGRFLKRVFSPEEIRYCKGKKKKWQHFAVRFAAKEAVWKAVGRAGLRLRDISIRRGPTGKPSVVLEGCLAPHIEISLTHSAQYAAAVALVSRPFPSPAGRKVGEGGRRRL